MPSVRYKNSSRGTCDRTPTVKCGFTVVHPDKNLSPCAVCASFALGLKSQSRFSPGRQSNIKAVAEELSPSFVWRKSGLKPWYRWRTTRQFVLSVTHHGVDAAPGRNRHADGNYRAPAGRRDRAAAGLGVSTGRKARTGIRTLSPPADDETASGFSKRSKSICFAQVVCGAPKW